MRNLGKPSRQQWTFLSDFEVGFKLLPKQSVILKRILLGVLFDKEIERVDDRHFGNQMNADFQFTHWLWKHDPRNPVAKGVLLPVNAVIGRANV